MRRDSASAGPPVEKKKFCAAAGWTPEPKHSDSNRSSGCRRFHCLPPDTVHLFPIPFNTGKDHYRVQPTATDRCCSCANGAWERLSTPDRRATQACYDILEDLKTRSALLPFRVS